jgi:LmbE family N-acetylglucosaminyl deacetylase
VRTVNGSPGKIVLSPHLDDLALSCFDALSDAVAATVFTAGPDGPGVLSAWDAACGASSSRDLMAARRDEDRRALAATDVTVRHLGFAEDHYRAVPLDATALEGALADLFAGATEVWLPAAVHGNPDHSTVRRHAFAALRHVPVPTVWLYAEYPYHQYLAAGRSSTVDALAEWFASRIRAGTAVPAVRALDDAALTRKRQAVGCYVSQLGPLNRTLGGRMLDDDLLRHEYAWRLR